MTLTAKAFSDIITFTRASNATRVAPNGLIQFAPHNLLLQSQTFQTTWVPTGVTIGSDVISAPDGTVTADGLVEDDAVSLHGVASASVTHVAATAYSTSVYAKKGVRNWVAIQVGTAAYGVTTRAWFNLDDGTLGTQTNCAASIQSVGGGWYRCVLAATTTAGGGGTVVIGAANVNGSQTYDGTLGQTGCYLWGAQLTQGPGALDYTPTTTAIVYGPRFDYDPVTLACRGLLIEEQRTNLLLNSAALVTQNVTVTAVVHTLSFYGTGTITLSGASTAGPAVGSGAYPTRTTLTFTPSAGTLTLTVSGSVTLAQLETGAFATSYIPTTTTSLTRSMDIASVNTLSPWFNATEGTLYAEMDVITVTQPTGYIGAFNDGTGSELFGIYQINDAIGAIDIDNGVVVANITRSAIVIGIVFKTAAVYKLNDIALVLNGGNLTTDTSAALPTVSTLNLGGGNLGLTPVSGHLRRFAYYPRRLSNNDLQALTA